MGSGNLEIIGVTGVSPTFLLEVVSSSGVVAGTDSLVAELATGEDAIYSVTNVPDGTHIEITDDIFQARGSLFGAPNAGDAAFATRLTPTELTPCPEGARGWRAAHERNWYLINDLNSPRLQADADVLTVDTIVNGEFLQRVGNTIVSSASVAGAHKATHVSGGGDTFVSGDLLEAQVKRVSVLDSAVPTQLDFDEIQDGEVLQRSGATIVGVVAGASTVLTSKQDGRISVSNTDSAPGADTTSANLYYVRHSGALIALLNGSFAYHTIPATPLSFDAGVDLDIDGGAIVTDTVYDVFVRDNTGLELGLKVWSNSGAGTSTRGFTLDNNQGVRVLNGATDWRFVGTVRTVTDSGIKFIDSRTKRYVWNMDNRIQRRNITGSIAGVSYTKVTTTIERLNAGAGDPAFLHEFVCGLPSDRMAKAQYLIRSSVTPNNKVYIAEIYVDAAQVPTADGAWRVFYQPTGQLDGQITMVTARNLDAGFHQFEVFNSTAAAGSSYTVFVDTFGAMYSEGEF